MAVREFTHFRLKTGGPNNLCREGSIVYDDSFKPEMAWRCLEVQGSVLAPVAVRVLNTLANSLPSERPFSATAHIHSKERNRLSVENSDKQTFVYMNSRVLERLRNTDLGRRKRWANLDEKDWMELEDSYLEIFTNFQCPQTYLGGSLAVNNPQCKWHGTFQPTGDLVALGTEIESVEEEGEEANEAENEAIRPTKRVRRARN